MAKNMEITLLFDFYGDMLTEKQRDMIELYYDNDLSLAEIAENEGITRQGVRDSIKRGEQTLFEMEEKFHLAERSEKYFAMMEEISELAGEIKNECVYCGNPKAIVKRAEYLKQLAEDNKELF